MKGKEERSNPENRRHQDEEIRKTLERVKHKILILSGKGGVGKSTVAVNLAAALAEEGYKVGLMDVDLHGPSVPRLLGLNEIKPGFADDQIIPVHYTENLKVVSIENFLDERDTAVIWRGPLKIGAIRQFLADVAWGVMDYLIIDSPPGTGDEPLTIAQTIPGARAIIVTTPQEISLADVRKSISFCRTVHLPIIGLIENMSGYTCPECGRYENIFGVGGGERTAEETGLVLLGKIPIDPNTVLAGDQGRPSLSEMGDTPATKAFREVVDAIVAANESATPPPLLSLVPEKKKETAPRAEGTNMVIAVPTSDGLLASHFGHCQHLAIFEIEDSRIKNKKMIEPPPHEPGVLPRLLREQGAEIIIAGGMGHRAQQFFNDFNIKVVTGAPAQVPERIVEHYLAGTLEIGENLCDH